MGGEDLESQGLSQSTGGRLCLMINVVKESLGNASSTVSLGKVLIDVSYL